VDSTLPPLEPKGASLSTISESFTACFRGFARRTGTGDCFEEFVDFGSNFGSFVAILERHDTPFSVTMDTYWVVGPFIRETPVWDLEWKKMITIIIGVFTKRQNYTLSEAWSGVNWAYLMAAQGAFGTDFYDRSTRTIVGTMLWTEYNSAPWAAIRFAQFSPLQASDIVYLYSIRS